MNASKLEQLSSNPEVVSVEKPHQSYSPALYRQIGVSRPPLQVEDLPTPEEAFKIKRIGVQEVILFILGPSLIALGISIGSGEWLSGPLAISKYGFRGLGWVILVSAILQVFYNVELGRFTLATGEPPIVAFGRVPPGYILWVPLALICLYMAFLLGSWAVSAGSSLVNLFTGRLYSTGELELVRILGIVLMVITFVIITIGRRIERTMEIIQGTLLFYILIGLLLVTLVIVPISYWGQALASLVIPAPLPQGADLTVLGALAGFTALASGLNFMFIGYYRDKGYGMGSRLGALNTLFSRKPDKLLTVGKIFPEDEKNAVRWRRWFRYLLIDQWGIYFLGAVAGILIPCILVGYLSSIPDVPPPDQNTINIYASLQLRQRFGPLVSGWSLLVGFAIMFMTQMVVLELLARNLTDAIYSLSARVRRATKEDPRRLYYPLMAALIVIIGIILHLSLPSQLTLVSANVANFAAMIFPLAMIYLNRKLPKPARITWWSYLVLILNCLFFGFFFINFLMSQGILPIP